jgi:hypothetical protein
MVRSLCGDSISSRRGLLASLWTLVSLTTLISFLGAFVFGVVSIKASEGDDDDYYNNREGGSKDEAYDPAIAVTTRALAFSALWTAVLSTLMSVFGTVILGWQSPLTGQYYTCCSSSVHRTTPLGLGSFIGALLMLSNLTLICSVLFGEFEVSQALCLLLILPFECCTNSQSHFEDSRVPRGRSSRKRGSGKIIHSE